MIKFIDAKLNSITMYRLTLYYLISLLGVAAVFSVLGVLPFNVVTLTLSTLFLVAVCAIVNGIFAKTLGVPANFESAYISALILALIITPAQSLHDLWFLAWTAVWAMASKYILAINKKHIFNPAAFAVAFTALTLNQTASWWVGDGPMLLFALLGGLLILRKTRRFEMVISFVFTSLMTTLAFTILNRSSGIAALEQTVLYSPLVFFAAIILTEPLTTPPTRNLQLIYGALIGFLISPQFHIGSFYVTPELSILIGNLFSYAVSPKAKLVLKLKDRVQIAPDTYNFIFTPGQKLSFAPGQYMEWTLGHENPDSRGNRRYFTLASSPTENDLILGVKFYKNSSSYKRSMLSMNGSSEIIAAQLAGDFVLPDDRNQRLVFVAGGIGITPFRSMIKYLLDTRERRPITLFYANRTANEIVYKDVFDRAQRELGIKTIYTLTDARKVPSGWTGKVGHITPQMIKAEVPHFGNCLFYLSGPNAMVTSFEETLASMHVNHEQIKTDFFPGFA